MRPGVTPAAWLARHVGDSLALFAVSDETRGQETWCARSHRRDVLPDGASVMRDAYFYVPDPPPSLELPTEGSAANLVASACVLGALWLETPQPDTALGRTLAARTSAALVQEYGVITAGPDSFMGRPVTDSQKQRLRRLPSYETVRLGIGFFGSAYWRAPGRWQRESLTVVSAYDAARDVQRRRVLVYAYFPHSDFDTFRRIREVLANTQPAPDPALDAAARDGPLAVQAIRTLPSSCPGFQRVIDTVEPMLPRTSAPVIRARLLLLLGDAYSDLVGLAAGMGEGYVDAASYASGAAAARKRAAALYREALELDRGAPRARDRWRQAWRLLAGLPPSTTHFFCVND